jgi:hypothetical protein
MDENPRPTFFPCGVLKGRCWSIVVKRVGRRLAGDRQLQHRRDQNTRYEMGWESVENVPQRLNDY